MAFHMFKKFIMPNSHETSCISSVRLDDIMTSIFDTCRPLISSACAHHFESFNSTEMQKPSTSLKWKRDQQKRLEGGTHTFRIRWKISHFTSSSIQSLLEPGILYLERCYLAVQRQKTCWVWSSGREYGETASKRLQYILTCCVQKSRKSSYLCIGTICCIQRMHSVLDVFCDWLLFSLLSLFGGNVYFVW